MSEKNICLKGFSHQLWQSYADSSLPAAQVLKLEEHLLECPHCLDIYLGIVEKKLAAASAPRLGEDFTAKVLKAIEQEQHLTKTAVKQAGDSVRGSIISTEVNRRVLSRDKEAHRNRKVNLLISYCAAAGIAMFFWVGGYFDGLSGSLGKSTDYLHPSEAVEKVSPSQGLIQTGWTKRVLENERPSVLDYFKLKKE